MKRFGVIADDLTGAMDTGCQFARLGLRTIVYLGPPWPEHSDVDVLVLNTESRHDPPSEAYSKVRQGAQSLSHRVIYKKVDSTMRGNVGQELEATLDELDLRRALVAPAFPASGRAVIDGRLLINGVPLHRTDFVDDPLCPPAEHIPTLLQSQSERQVGSVRLSVVQQGAQALVDEIAARAEEILVLDASTQEHLLIIAGAAARLEDTCLATGSAGLARALPTGFNVRADKEASPSGHRGGSPVLAVAGSRREATVAQIKRAVSGAGVLLVEVDPHHIEETTKRSVLETREALSEGRDVIVTCALGPHLPERSGALDAAMADVTAQAAASQELGGLILTGGSVAFSVCRELGIQVLEVEGEIAPGVPVGRVPKGYWEGTSLVSKAGGFGEEGILVTAIEYLRGEGE
jgi:uncharacterized protein YgbK (DUF1537 family)